MKAIKLFLLCLCLSLTAPVKAIELGYEGYLQDSEGAALNGSHTLTFRIYDAATSGRVLWQQQLQVDVQNGLFATQLGGGNFPIPSSLFNIEDLWMGITIQGDPAELSPRQKFTAVARAKVAETALTANSVTDGSITRTKIGANAVDSSKIQDSSVTGADILNSTIHDIDIRDEPGIAYSSGNQTVTLTTSDVSVRSVTLSAPTSGFALVNASGYFDFNDSTRNVARCSITNGATTIDFTHLTVASDDGINGHTGFIPFATTRVYPVAAGTNIFRLVCESLDGSAQVGDTSLNALFVPTRYQPLIIIN